MVTIFNKLENENMQPFSLKDCTLLDGIFNDIKKVNADMMATISADCVLYAFRFNANMNYGGNLEMIGTGFGGWGAAGHQFAGHIEGHYMSSAAMLYAQSKDTAIKIKLDEIVEGLSVVQQTLTPKIAGEPAGYLSAFPETRFDDLEDGKSAAVPWYMIHKILQGLIDVYMYTNHKKALQIATDLGDWSFWRISRLSEQQMQDVLALEEYGGMNDVLIHLAEVTHDEKYISLASRFEQKALLLDPLYEGIDNLAGHHGNTFLAKIVGTASTYNNTAHDYYRIVTQNFWNHVVNDGRTYVIGGNTVGEYFKDANTLSEHIYGDTCETCNAYNMLKITKNIFEWTCDSKYADFYEKVLFNQILGSMNRENGDKTYPIYMAPNSKKIFKSTIDEAFCCNGTGLESFAKMADSIYFHNHDDLYVNQFIASKLFWKEKGFELKQVTSFPEEAFSQLEILVVGVERVNLYIRVPIWSEGGLKVKINGTVKTCVVNQKGYIVLVKKWNVGDVVEIAMNMQFGMEVTDDKNIFAFTYGPLAMVGIGHQKGSGKIALYDRNAFLDSLDDRFAAVGDRKLSYVMKDDAENVIDFKPFYQVQSDVYTTYWTL
jgi:DUF1680 family protein